MSAKYVRQYPFPILSGSTLSLFSLIVKPSGIREPHWHPNASELGYILEGSARLIVLSPGSSIDTFEVGPGEIYFIPTGFFPYIENLDSSENIIPCNALLPLSKVSQQLKKWTFR